MKLIEVNGLSSGYGKKQVLTDVRFSVSSHELAGILGANGCGKTTLLKTLCGMLPGQGEVRICGSDIRKMHPKELAKVCRVIPQRCGISISISLLDVVLMGFNPLLGLFSAPNADMRRRAEEALHEVGLGDRINSDFQTLSEGQKQLCLLARALILEKGALLLDEPESALDFRERYRMLDLVRGWLRKRDGCAVVTLHDPQLALNTCDRLLLMKDGTAFSVISPKEDGIDSMREALSAVFGALSVFRCKDRSGRDQLVLLKEEG